ncbi:MAG: hypothetical protein II502_00110, partial [Paludibacteraceae bacterium]|nr:hypothetical protein [Paludibacteraceae bacterium]
MKRLFFALLLLFCVSVEMFADAIKLPEGGVTPIEYIQQMGVEAEHYTWTDAAYCKWLQGQTFDFLRMHVPEPPIVSVALVYYGNDGTGIWYDFDDNEF